MLNHRFPGEPKRPSVSSHMGAHIQARVHGYAPLKERASALRAPNRKMIRSILCAGIVGFIAGYFVSRR